ncbi:MAG: DUF305 domain-containing protein, partial [bacterium]
MRGICAAVLLVGLLAPTILAAVPATAPPDPTIVSLSKLSGAAFDTAFMRALIPVDEEAIEIALAATLNANHVELLKWNQVLVERKNQQVRRMLAWLKEA